MPGYPPPDATSMDELRMGTTALVWCGGRSRRMGRDKARLAVDGRPLLERAIRCVESLGEECLLACGPEPRYVELAGDRVRLVIDTHADGGPLAGLAAGLDAARTEWLVGLACDMPGVSSELLAALLAEARAQDADVCLPRGPAGDEPLCAVYRRTCLGPVRAALADGERRMTSFWGRPGPGGRPLRIQAFNGLAGGNGRDPFRNLNTPEDLDLEDGGRD